MRYIEVLDSKNGCTKCFLDGFLKEIPDLDLTSIGPLCTYEWSPHLESFPDVTVAAAYCKPVKFEENQFYVESLEKIKSHLRAIRNAKVSKTVCLGDLIPFRVYSELCRARSEVVLDFVSVNQKPEYYEHLLKIEKLIQEISLNPIELNSQKIRSSKQASIVKSGLTSVYYDAKKAITGRLTTKKGSFPIMTLSSKDRGFVVPSNDLLIEFDYNSAEIRTLISFSGHGQPPEDLHTWNLKNCFDELTLTRKEGKEKFFAWLYNSTKNDKNLEKIYDKKVYIDYYKNGVITTPFGRKIRVIEKNALNYLLQSTSSDVMLEQAFKVRQLLSKKRTFIKFLMHDSIVLDVSKEDMSIMKDVFDTFRKTRLGEYLVNVRYGKDFYNMENLKWKM